MTDVVILAAGPGTRLRPLTHDRPKSMLLAAGQPIIHHLLSVLSELEVKSVVLVTGHGHDALQSFVGDGSRFGMKVKYVQQAKQLGPGHALLQARAEVKGNEFLLLPADAWCAPAIMADLLDHPGPALLQVPDARASRHGIPLVRAGRAVDLEPTGPPEAHPSGGAYRLPQSIFKDLEANGMRLRDAVRADVQRKDGWRLVVAKSNAYVDVIEVRDLLDLHARLMAQITPERAGTVEPGATVTGAVHIGSGSVVRAGCIVQGPVHIGEHCDVGPGAILQPGTSIRNQVRVQPFSLLANCVIQSNVEVGSHSRIERAYVDRGAVLGSGSHVLGGPGAIIGADSILEADAKVLPGGSVGRSAKVALGRAVTSVPDGGAAV